MQPAYLFPPYRLVPAQRLLSMGGTPVKLGGRAFDMLVALVERRDRTVSKDELMDLVWPRLVVEENNLQVQVVALRKLLGHAAIATVPGRGYRFTLPVAVEGDGAPSASPSVPPGAAPGAAQAHAGAHTTPSAAAPATPTNLPHWLAPLLGREQTLATLLDLMDRHAWVTVVGPAGIGKTRLALAAAKARCAALPGGVWWVDLTSVADPALVPHALALAMGVRNEGPADLVATLAAALPAQPTLVVLDNAEHLLDGVAALLARLRPLAGALRIVLTSQEVLHAADEQVFRVEPLSLPAAGTPDAAEASGAVALFVARAQAVDRHFVLTAQNREAVADICRRLDGIPLAIELAAARVPLLGVEGLRARLDQRFELLTAGDRTALRRHRTLRQALAWSHQLLSAGEQAVFRRLGVFAGGFTLAAAQAVAAGDGEHGDHGEQGEQGEQGERGERVEHGIDRWDVLEHLGRLVDKSLVVADGDPLPRYRLLETMRLFALERLIEHGEADAVRSAHRAHFVEVAEAAREAMNAGRAAPTSGLPVLDLERDNLLLAQAWTRGEEGAVQGLRLAEALVPYWSARGMLLHGLRHLESTLSHPGGVSPEPSALRCRVEVLAANLGSLLGRIEEARRHGSAALKMARRLGDDGCMSFALAALANLHERSGELAAARRCAEQALELARRTADPLAQRRVLIVLSAVHDRAGRHDLALEMDMQCLAHSRAGGHVRFEAEDHLNLAWMHCRQERPEGARRHLGEVLALLPQMDSQFYGVAVLRTAAAWAAYTRRHEPALQLHAAHAAQSRRIGLDDPIEPWEAARLQQAAAAVDATTREGAERLGRHWTYGEALAVAAGLLAQP